MAGSFTILALTALAATAASHDVEGAGTQPARPPQQRSGTITMRDHPASALRQRAEGTSIIDMEIAPDGRVIGCKIAGSSGNAALDATACSLAQRRFRFTPAGDAKGRPVAGRSSRTVDWRLPDGNPDSSGKTPAPD